MYINVLFLELSQVFDSLYALCENCWKVFGFFRKLRGRGFEPCRKSFQRFDRNVCWWDMKSHEMLCEGGDSNPRTH